MKLTDSRRFLARWSLQAWPKAPINRAPRADASQTPEEVAQTHRRLAEEYERLLEHIRGLPDFSDFLLPPKSASLCNAAVSGPIVVVNTHEDRCDALILLPNSSQVSHVPLPELRVSYVKNAAQIGGVDSGNTMQSVPVGHMKRQHCQGGMKRCRISLGSSGCVLRSPFCAISRSVSRMILVPLCMVLTVGEVASKARAGKMPHITWCLTGRLTFLPIHAAGLYGEKDQPKIFDYVVSSYTPTLTALLNAQTSPFARYGSPRLLAVSQPEAPMQKSLPGTTREVNVIRAFRTKLAVSMLHH